MEPTVDEARPRRANVAVRSLLFVALFVKVLLRKILLIVFLGVRTAFQHKFSTAVIAVLLVALVLTNLRAASTSGGALASPAAAASAAPPPPSVSAYLRGQANFDAGMMWNAMSDDFKQSFTEQGGSQQALQQSMDAAKSAGRQLTDATYVSSYRLGDGRTVYFFVLTLEQGGQVGELPYLFTTDPQGVKIDRID